jgi:hypothetical protein
MWAAGIFISVTYVRSRGIGVNEFTFRIKYLEEFQTVPEVLDLRTNALAVASGDGARRWVMRDCIAQAKWPSGGSCAASSALLRDASCTAAARWA